MKTAYQLTPTEGAAPVAAAGAPVVSLPADEPPSAATTSRQRYLFEQVVAGIGGYGNCMGIPTVAGEVYFEDPYAGNCLVNAMTVGLVGYDQIIRSKAAGVGNHVVLIGSKTGRDGIGGASVLASQVFDETLEEKRPSVQVGDPFTEKKLLEACLELLRADLLVALQDLGAAGITSSSSEMAAKGDVGIDLHADRVPLREADMEPWEIMISESQERMLCIVAPESWDGVKAVCDRWDLDATIVGDVTDTKHLRVFYRGEMAGDMDATALAEPPIYNIPQERPAHEVDEPLDPTAHPAPNVPLSEILVDLVGSPNIASRRWVWQQYDHQVQLNTVIVPGGDAALLRIKKTGAGIAVCTDGNGRQAYLDPYRGGKAAVCEAARNVSCVGAKPIAITNCLNFGNPDNGPIAYQLARAIEGMAEACEALGTPVISGNVSLYNESFEQPIYPTPVVGMLGVMDDVAAHCTVAFKADGDLVYLMGDAVPALDGSEYQKRWFGGARGRPAGRIPDVDLEAEVALQAALREAIAAGLLRSAHDCSDGGLAVAVVESCMAGSIGATISLADVPWVGGCPGCAASAGGGEGRTSVAGVLAARPDLAFFGETPTLVVVSIASADLDRFEDLCEASGVPYTQLGVVGGPDLFMGLTGTGALGGADGTVIAGSVAASGRRGGTDSLWVSVAALDEVYETALRRALGE